MPKGNPEGYKRKKKRTYGGRDLGSGMASRARKANIRDQMRRDDQMKDIMSVIRRNNTGKKK